MYMHVTPFFSNLCSDRVSAIVGVDGGVGGRTIPSPRILTVTNDAVWARVSIVGM